TETSRRTIAIPAGSLPWMQPTTSSWCAAVGLPSTTGRIAAPSTLWPTGSAARKRARSRTYGHTFARPGEVRRLHTMRRLGAIAALALLAAGCGGGSGTTSQQTTGQSKAFVVLVTDINQLNDHGFNQLAYQGLKRAQRELGIRGAVYQSPSAQAYIPNLSTAARKGADLVISVGFDQANAIS